MEIGCAVEVLRGGAAEGRLRDIRSLGIAFIEPQFTPPDAYDAEDEAFIDRARDELTQADVAVWSVHAPFGPEVDLSSEKAAVRERGIAAAVRSARGCAALGGRLIVVHCSDTIGAGADRDAALARATGSIVRIAHACRPIGIRVAVENLPPGYLTDTGRELMAVVEQFPPESVGVCVDTGHAHIAEEDADLVETASARIITTHQHDNDGTGDQHYVPGAGTIDWSLVGKALAASPYDGPLMFEVGGPGSHADTLARLPGASAMIRSHA